MVGVSRRLFGVGALACACAALGPAKALAQGQGGRYRCPPCGCAMDGKLFDAPGICPACGMALVPVPAWERQLSPSEQRADIAAFRRGFMDLDRAYAPEARAEAERRLARLENADRLMSTAEFLVALGQIAALADNGHSMCSYPFTPDVTLGFGHVAGEFHVLSAPPEQADLLGAQLVAIEGRPMAAVRPVVRTLFGGVPARQDLRAADTLSRPDYLQALGLAATPEAATYRLKTSSGEVVERRLAPSRRGPSWARLPSPGRTPWALEQPEQHFRWRDAPEFDAVMAQLRRNLDGPDRKIGDFLAEVEANRSRLNRANVVLDMRQNIGGDFLTTRDFLLAWPGRVAAPGRFFVLVGPMTFSAGIASIAFLKQAGGDRVILIGEAPGDRMMYFAEGRATHLPYSGAEVTPGAQRNDLANGCRDYDDCFAALARPGASTISPPEQAGPIDRIFGRKPVSVRSLDPDIPAPWSIADYAMGRDPAWQAIAAYRRTR